MNTLYLSYRLPSSSQSSCARDHSIYCQDVPVGGGGGGGGGEVLDLVVNEEVSVPDGLSLTAQQTKLLNKEHSHQK